MPEVESENHIYTLVNRQSLEHQSDAEHDPRLFGDRRLGIVVENGLGHQDFVDERTLKSRFDTKYEYDAIPARNAESA